MATMLCWSEMRTINISLPDSLMEYVRKEAEGNYGNVSEFFREMLRSRLEKAIEADLKLLESTCMGTPGPSEEELKHVLEIKRRVRQRMRERKERAKKVGSKNEGGA